MYNINETASHFVDPQFGFTPLCPEELPVKDGDKIVPALLEQLKYACKKTVSKDAHNRKAIWVASEKQKQFDLIEGDNVDVAWNSHCNIGELGFELLIDLPLITEYDYVVWKGIELTLHPYSSCYHDLSKKLSTGLIEYYKVNNIKNVIVGGLATDYCTYETCKDLSVFFNVILNLEGCRGVMPDTTEHALNDMFSIGIKIVNKTSDLKELFK